jgi:AAA+ ATPase superfamily predicted ATPase
VLLLNLKNSCKKIFKGKPEGRRGTCRPRKRYLNDVEDDLKQLKVRGWRRKTRERKEWAKILKEAKALQGL